MTLQQIVLLVVLGLAAWVWWRDRARWSSVLGRLGFLTRGGAVVSVFGEAVDDVVAAVRPGALSAVRSGAVPPGDVAIVEPRQTARGLAAELGPISREVNRQVTALMKSETHGAQARWRGLGEPVTVEGGGVRLSLVAADVPVRRVVVAHTPEAALIRAEELVAELAGTPASSTAAPAASVGSVDLGEVGRGGAPTAGAPSGGVPPRIRTQLRPQPRAGVTQPDDGAVEVSLHLAGKGPQGSLLLRNGTSIMVGRDAECDLQVPPSATWVSGRHVEIRRSAGRVQVRDLSRLGTWLRTAEDTWTPLPAGELRPARVGSALALDDDATVTVVVGRATRRVTGSVLGAAGGASR
jgi:hypothetical protein